MRTGFRVALLTGLLQMAQFAVACTCRPEPSFEDAFAAASEVFLAEVVHISTEPGRFDTVQKMDVQIHASWKGSFQGAQQMLGGGLCGFWFKEGDQYLIYGSSGSGLVGTSMCTRTREYARAADDLGRLGGPKWVSHHYFAAVPKECAGLSVSIRPAKKRFTPFDDVAFDVTLRNRSRRPILLPRREDAAGTFIDIVVQRNNSWWTTLTRDNLAEHTYDWSALQPGESRTMVVSQRGAHIRAPGEHTVQAVIHYSTTTPGLWTGYVFSEPKNFTMEDYHR